MAPPLPCPGDSWGNDICTIYITTCFRLSEKFRVQSVGSEGTSIEAHRFDHYSLAPKTVRNLTSLSLLFDMFFALAD